MTRKSISIGCVILIPTSMGRLSKFTERISRKIQDQPAAEAAFLTPSNRRKFRTVGIVLGLVFVGLFALWMAHHP
jgi:hypothetical protein